VALISPEKIAEWLQEIEQRPASGPIIVQYIANRLSELTARNEELLAENIELRSGRKVEEYETRIANLEYQLELLKRQVGGQAPTGEAVLQAGPHATERASLLVYNPQGQVLRVEIDPAGLVSGEAMADFRRGEISGETRPQLLATGARQELLFVFDSGRTAAMPVSAIPTADPQDLTWRQAALQEPRGIEELAFVMPIARMALSDFAVQASRRGFVKKIKRALLENYISKDYIGSGVKLPSDRTCSMAFCNSGDLFGMASREGFIFSIAVDELPFSVEEALRLGMADHIVSTFSARHDSSSGQPEPSILVITHNGKAINREVSWLEPASSFKTHGQPVYSKEKRLAGVRVVAAALTSAEDWGFALTSDGKVTAHKISDLFGTGTLLGGASSVEVIGFSVFHP
jgi:DNA gyrase/topoisomerase IV subunit A